jgi:hypothetical protein
MALSAAFREITPANGYIHDLSGTGKQNKVFRGRAVFGEGDPLPMVSILEPPLPPDQQLSPASSRSITGRWEQIVQGFVQDDKNNPTDPAQRLVADVLQRLAVEKAKEGGKPYCLGFRRIKSIIIGPPVVRPPDDLISSKAYFWVSISIDMVEDLLHPYED